MFELGGRWFGTATTTETGYTITITLLLPSGANKLWKPTFKVSAKAGAVEDLLDACTSEAILKFSSITEACRNILCTSRSWVSMGLAVFNKPGRSSYLHASAMPILNNTLSQPYDYKICP
eukprot:scaffold133371_cov15-Tisochrysis_lutea.AAC.1